MNKPPAKAADPRAAVALLARLTTLAQELAGAFRPATVVELVARTLVELLQPDRLSVILLDAESHRLAVTYDTNPVPARTDDPLLQLALRRGPLAFVNNVAEEARRRGAQVPERPPGSWLGAPLVAAGRTLGAVSLSSDRPGALGPAELALVLAVLAEAAIALENARLVELLSSAKREWEKTVDAISQAICIVDAHGTVRRANRVFAELIQTPVTAIPGRPWISLLPPAWSDPVARTLAEATTTAVEIRAGERILLLTVIPMAEPGSAVLVFEDQTDRRRLQEQLIQSEKMSAIGQLIAGVAHDLNNPLASVVGFSDFLVEAGEVPASLAEPLQVIRQEAERAATIVKNLLSFARSQEGERKRQSIGAILESTLVLLRNQLMAHKVEATLELEPELPDVEANANQLKQVFVNLINNASQAIASDAPSGRIWIAAKRTPDGIAVSVTDSGPGMTEAIAARVFEPFFTTKGEGEGTGLGLSICQGIVKEHGGRISLETKPGAGAAFTVELPIGATAPAGEGAPVPATGGRAQGRALRILVVDDEPHILYYMRATLESWGHTVEVASDGAYALERALAEAFDVIICDLRMPHLSGRDMYTRLARQDPHAAERIIFATGDTVRGDTLQFLERLGRPYLHKPFTLAELRSALGHAAKQPV
ncbi:MAG TPA: ATP-binding protein [Gemmatimonadales bacterium]|nr:ATP-binding protein [Gemmatimonadales bacterium]